MSDCFYIGWVILEYFVGNRRQEGVCLVVTACTFQAQPSLCRAEIVSILLFLLLLLPLLFNINHCILSNLLWVHIFKLPPPNSFVLLLLLLLKIDLCTLASLLWVPACTFSTLAPAALLLSCLSSAQAPLFYNNRKHWFKLRRVGQVLGVFEVYWLLLKLLSSDVSIKWLNYVLWWRKL